MYYHTCEKCGANLDPGERCDCEDQTKQEPDRDLDDLRAIVLRSLRIDRKIKTKDIVAMVRGIYPRYDKSLNSKCERGDEYGITLRTKAMAALLAQFSPEIVEKVKHKRDGGHKLKRKVMCRLPEDEYSLLQQRIRAEGYATMQSWLRDTIKRYIAK